MSGQQQQPLPHGHRLQGKKQEYVIDRALGQGSFGITYLAKYKQQVRGEMGTASVWAQVAVKEFFMRDLNSREEGSYSLRESTGNSLVAKYRRAFMREAQNLSHMRHPGIVSVLEVIEANNTAYIVMEYIEGSTLDDYIQRCGRLPEREALACFRDICDAMCYMHAQRMLHLDMKPKNVMRDEEGRLSLIDFGLSKQYTESGEPESSTSIGLGTPGYAPGEQGKRLDDGKFHATLDVYALGATLLKMLTGQTPPEASDVLDDDDLVPSLLRRVGVGKSVIAVVAKAMSPKRKERYQSVAELMAAFGWKAKAYQKEEQVGEDTDEGTDIDEEPKPKPRPTPRPNPTPSPKPSVSGWLYGLLAGVLLVLAVVFWPKCGGHPDEWDNPSDTLAIDSVAIDSAVSLVEAVLVSPTQPTSPTQPSAPDAVYGTLKVQSEPSGATIWLDGKRRGTTPELLEQLVVGSHKLRLSMEGYEEVTRQVKVVEGRNADVKVVLKAKQSPASVPPPTPSPSTSGRDNGHEYVDLGLSVKWATCNVGASSPGGYGDYFAWGETSPKSSYTWENLKYRVSGDSYDNVTFSKYVATSKYGTVDNCTRLELSDDAARQQWGGSWRMPTSAEFDELVDKCQWNWTTEGGHRGYKVTGPNGRSIFLPAAGCRYGSSLSSAGEDGHYWSSSLGTSYSNNADNLYFSGSGHGVNNYYRYYGQSVRPVTE